MKADVKRRWVKALRSGKYKQGRQYLRQTLNGQDKFCCLGAVTDICGKRWNKGRTKLLEAGVQQVFCFRGNAGTLDGRFRAEIGLTDSEEAILATKNDSGRWSFKRIATWIEKNL